MNANTFASTLENPKGRDELKAVGWEEYVENLKRPYPPELLEAARETGDRIKEPALALKGTMG